MTILQQGAAGPGEGDVLVHEAQVQKETQGQDGISSGVGDEAPQPLPLLRPQGLDLLGINIVLLQPQKL